MKRIMYALIIILFANFSAFAIDIENELNKDINTLDKTNILKYYNINENYTFELKQFTKTYIKTILTKEEKKEYKKLTKIERYIKKYNFKKAFDIEEHHFPTLVSYYHFLEHKKDYSRAINYLQLIIQKNTVLNLLDPGELVSDLANISYKAKNYQLALNTINQNKNLFKENDYFFFVLHDIHYNLKNYSSCIYYAKKIENNKDYKAIAKETIYLSYKALNNEQLAYKYAQDLVKNYPNEINYIRIVLSTKNIDEKTFYLEKLLDLYGQTSNYDKAISLFIHEVEPILQKKIEKATKGLTGYFKIPCWSDIFREDYKYMKPQTVYYRQKDFYNDMTNCINKYKYNDLKACFNDVDAQQKIVTQKLIEEKRAEEQKIAEEQRIRQMQLMNYNLMQQNNLIQQQNYQLSRPRYTNTTTTRYGNTYYSNSYSY